MPSAQTTVALPRWAVAVSAAWVLGLHPLLSGLDAGVGVVGLLDWSGHLATAVLVLANLPRALPLPFAAAALVGSVAIDLDHVPGYLGSHAIDAGTPRPYTHSLMTVIGLGVIALALLRGRARLVVGGLAAGVALHLCRDVATGPGVAGAWPLSDAAWQLPFWVYTAVMAALAVRAWQRSGRLPQVTEGPLPGAEEPAAAPRAASSPPWAADGPVNRPPEGPAGRRRAVAPTSPAGDRSRRARAPRRTPPASAG